MATSGIPDVRHPDEMEWGWDRIPNVRRDRIPDVRHPDEVEWRRDRILDVRHPDEVEWRQDRVLENRVEIRKNKNK